jgi:hypothetical protein
VEISSLLTEIAAADDPPTKLDSDLARLQSGGAIEVFVARQTDKGVVFQISTAEQEQGDTLFLVARGRRVVASQRIDRGVSATPLRDALDRLVVEFQGFDRIARFRFAEKDMELAGHAAVGLIMAVDGRGAARVFARVIETGMVVTYVRPFLPSNDAGLPKGWLPKAKAERELHDELIQLRSEYHAHADHTSQRGLDILSVGEFGRPLLLETWTRLSVWKLELLRDMANSQRERFAAEAERLDLELFGPRDET